MSDRADPRPQPPARRRSRSGSRPREGYGGVPRTGGRAALEISLAVLAVLGFS